MPISKTDQLVQLVSSLSKAEKRNFRLYAKRVQDKDDLMFLRLFDEIEKNKKTKDEDILAGLGGIKKTQYSNLKRHLYSQIITSLRLLHKEKRANIKVREYIDFAYILYGKGLNIQALKLLNKASTLAKRHHLIYMQQTIYEVEKFIETRHITRSGQDRASELIELSTELQTTIANTIAMSNLRMKLHTKYLRYGHVANAQEESAVRSSFENQIKAIDPDSLGVMEYVYLMQSYVWFHHILLEFEHCLRYAQKWVAILNENTNMINRDVDLLMRGYHYVLTASNNIRNLRAHTEYLSNFEQFRKSEYHKFNANSQIIAFLYVHTARLDNIILSGEFSRAKEVIPRVLSRLKKYLGTIDDHRILVFYFKIAWIHLGNNEADKALEYLNKIVNKEFKNLREDLQNYSRILFLICHYELQNIGLLPYIIRNTKSYFKGRQDLNQFLQHAISLFEDLKNKGVMDHKGVFKKYENIFAELASNRYDKRAFIYLDINSWLESKVKNISLAEVVKSKAN